MTAVFVVVVFVCLYDGLQSLCWWQWLHLYSSSSGCWHGHGPSGRTDGIVIHVVVVVVVMAGVVGVVAVAAAVAAPPSPSSVGC